MRLIVVLLVLSSLMGCASNATKARNHPEFAITYPAMAKPLPNNSGSIFQSSQGLALFQDEKARQIGDIILVQLSERTNASTSASSSTNKASSVSSSVGLLMGYDPARGQIPLLNTTLSSAKDFAGDGDSRQSNSLTGTIAVTVSEVLTNGYLVVRGEKLISINQGDEYVRLSGIIRPRDIDSENMVASSQVANAQIVYGGKGVIGNANEMGWLDRFLQSSWWPL